MNRNMWKKAVLKTAGISILAVLFYTSCDDNGVKVVTPEVTTFVDGRDGKTYKKVKIGSQIWMAENLRYEAEYSVCYDGITHGSWGHWNDPEGACEEFGRLYDWQTAMDYRTSSDAVPSGVEGVCPVGWHIPSDAEWQTLIDYVEPNAGTKLKSREWHSEGNGPGGVRAPDGTDKYRFSALPGGYYDYNGSNVAGVAGFAHLGWNGLWWSATETEGNEKQAWLREIAGAGVNVVRLPFDKHHFLSVRCVHD